MKKIILIVLMVMAYMFVSDDDYERELEDDAEWCKNIRDGIWHDDPGVIAARCGVAE